MELIYKKLLEKMADIVDLNSNLYDQTTFAGRASHFYRSVNPLNLFKDHALARETVLKVKSNGGVLPEGKVRNFHTVLFLRYVFLRSREYGPADRVRGKRGKI